MERTGSLNYLKPISPVKKLKATTGRRTIAGAKETFPVYIDPIFKLWGLDVEGIAKPETLIQVFQQIKNGTYADILGGISDNLDSLFFSEDQVIEFCESYADYLCTDLWIHLPFKAGNRFFVAVMLGHGLFVDGHEFSYLRVWRTEDGSRFVLPQQIVFADIRQDDEDYMGEAA